MGIDGEHLFYNRVATATDRTALLAALDQYVAPAGRALIGALVTILAASTITACLDALGVVDPVAQPRRTRMRRGRCVVIDGLEP